MSEKRTDRENKIYGTSENSKAVPQCESLSFAAKEAFKRLRTNVLISFQHNKSCYVIGITSAQPSEGKSTVALNLAYSIAELDKKVLLIDADLRRPSLHIKTGVVQSPGLSNLLLDINSVSVGMRKYTSSDGTVSLSIIPGGDIPQNPSELLNSLRAEKLIKALTTSYDYIIIDLPPVGAVTDAVAVSRYTDGMIVVLRENSCPQNVFRECVDQLRYANAKILGFVMNGTLEGAGKKYQYNNYYYYR